MRAICCAILALVFHQMMRTKAGDSPTMNDLSIAGIYLILQYISIASAIALCIAGL